MSQISEINSEIKAKKTPVKLHVSLAGVFFESKKLGNDLCLGGFC